MGRATISFLELVSCNTTAQKMANGSQSNKHHQSAMKLWLSEAMAKHFQRTQQSELFMVRTLANVVYMVNAPLPSGGPGPASN